MDLPISLKKPYSMRAWPYNVVKISGLCIGIYINFLEKCSRLWKTRQVPCWGRPCQALPPR